MKEWLKGIVRGGATLLVGPLALLVRLVGSESFFVGAGQGFALVPGKIGSYLRVAYYGVTLDSCARDVYIGFGSYFSHPQARVGHGVYIGAYCIVGMADIGDHCTIGSGVHILSGKHQHGFREIGKPIQQQPGQFTPIAIGENTWIGNGAIVMADLGRQNVIGAGSVVVKPSEDLQILAGNPAQVISMLAGAQEGLSSGNLSGFWL